MACLDRITDRLGKIIEYLDRIIDCLGKITTCLDKSTDRLGKSIGDSIKVTETDRVLITW